MELTGAQLEFIEKFIIKGFFAKRTDKAKTHNKEVRAAYESFLAQRAQAESLLNTLPPDHDTVTRYRAEFQKLSGIEEDDTFAGDFVNLLDRSRQLIEDATNFQGALRTMKKKLLADLTSAGSVPIGAKPAETLAIGRMRAQGIALLAAEFPTRGAMSDVPALVREMKDIATGVEARAGLSREANTKFAALLPAITAIPADHPETAGFETTRTELNGDLAAADSSEDYSAAITQINLLESTVEAFKTKLKGDKQDLLDQLTAAAKAAEGSDEDEADALNEILQEAQTLLAAELPSKTNMTSAAAKVVILGVKQDKIGERISKTAFEEALALARAAIDSIPDDHAQVVALEASYKELDDELKDESHEGGFNAEKLKADNIVVNADAAKTAIRQEKQKILDDLAKAGAAPEDSLPAEEQALTAIVAEGTALLQDDVPSRANLDQAAAKIGAAIAKAGEIRVRVKLAALNLPQGSDTAAAAENALKSFESVLKGATVTKEMKDQALAASRTASSELAATLAKKPPASSEEKAAAKQKYLDAKKMSDAVLGSELLASSLAPGGALTATSPMKTSDEAKAQFIEGMIRAPGVTGKAMEACKYSKHADAVAAKIDSFATMIENGVTGDGPGFRFANPGHSEVHAGNLLANGAHRGEDYLDGAVDYVNGKWPVSNNGMSSKSGDKWVQLASRRASAVAGAFLSEGDPYDLDSDASRQALADLNYGYSSLRPPTPVHAEQIEETLTLLNEEETKEKFRSATKPTGNGATLAVELMKQVHGDSWVPPDPLTPEITQQALMIAMFNPIEQGSVGSCFATAGLITLRKQDPQRALDIYKQALEHGTFTPLKQPDDIVDPLPVPLVLEYTQGDNPITRSIEYTAATAGAALETSNDGKSRDASISRALRDPGLVAELDALSGGAGDEALLDRLQLATELATQITFVWDATAPMASTSADGSSSFGCYVAYVGGTRVHDADYDAGQAKFTAAALVIAKKVYKDKLKTPEDETKLEEVINSAAFVNSFKSGKTAIWQMHGGGAPADVDRVLLDAQSETTNLPGIPARDPSQTESERTLDVVAGLMGQFDGSDKNISLFTRGQHIFNGTQDDPSQDAIRGKSKAEIEVFFTNMGNEVIDLDLPKEQAAKIYDDALARALSAVPDDLKGTANTALDTKRPGAAMKSPAVSTAITEGQDAMWTAVMAAVTDTHVNAWVATQGSKYNGKTSAEKKTAYEAELRKQPPQDTIRRAMAANLPMPDPVVIADTNWGGSGSHTYFVIAPDPADGKPIMWQKTEPPGSMSPAGRDWMDRTWAQTKPKPPANP